MRLMALSSVITIIILEACRCDQEETFINLGFNLNPLVGPRASQVSLLCSGFPSAPCSGPWLVPSESTSSKSRPYRLCFLSPLGCETRELRGFSGRNPFPTTGRMFQKLQSLWWGDRLCFEASGCVSQWLFFPLLPEPRGDLSQIFPTRTRGLEEGSYSRAPSACSLPPIVLS